MNNNEYQAHYRTNARNVQLKMDEMLAERIIPANDSVRLLDQTVDEMCFDVENPSRINYMACYHVSDISKAREMGLGVREIKETEYAILSLKGPVPTCIHEGWKYAMEVFLPEQGYMHAGTPDFEVYSEGDMNSPEYKMELWIPIVKQ